MIDKIVFAVWFIYYVPTTKCLAIWDKGVVDESKLILLSERRPEPHLQFANMFEKPMIIVRDECYDVYVGSQTFTGFKQ